MSTPFPHHSQSTLADDGDDFTFCSTCAFSQACLAEGMDKSGLRNLHMLVEHTGPLHTGDHVFRAGDPFEAIAAVRSGTVKTYTIDREGREHVLGFHFPGEVIGLDGIDGDRYPCNAVALDTVMLCQFSFPKISVLAAQLPGLQRHLFRLLSRNIGRAALLAARGFSPHRFQLTMARTDIGNYLRLAPETVSRVLRRFQQDGLLQIERRDVELLDRARLEALAEPILRS